MYPKALLRDEDIRDLVAYLATRASSIEPLGSRTRQRWCNCAAPCRVAAHRKVCIPSRYRRYPTIATFAATITSPVTDEPREPLRAVHGSRTLMEKTVR